MLVRKLYVLSIDELNVNINEIESGVNDIFLPYGVEWDVQLREPFIDKSYPLYQTGIGKFFGMS